MSAAQLPLSAGRAAAARSLAMSGQNGWKAPHHCSGASPMSCSKRAASASVRASTSARRLPVCGTAISVAGASNRSGPTRRQRPTITEALCVTASMAGPSRDLGRMPEQRDLGPRRPRPAGRR